MVDNSNNNDCSNHIKDFSEPCSQLIIHIPNMWFSHKKSLFTVTNYRYIDIGVITAIYIILVNKMFGLCSFLGCYD